MLFSQKNTIQRQIFCKNDSITVTLAEKSIYFALINWFRTFEYNKNNTIKWKKTDKYSTKYKTVHFACVHSIENHKHIWHIRSSSVLSQTSTNLYTKIHTSIQRTSTHTIVIVITSVYGFNVCANGESSMVTSIDIFRWWHFIEILNTKFNVIVLKEYFNWDLLIVENVWCSKT